MSKEAYYFSHDSNARNDEKLLAVRMRHKSAGYGIYFMILERLRDSNNYTSIKDYNVIAFDLREDAGLIKSVVEDFGLFVFTDDGKYFYSESFNQRMTRKDLIKTQQSIKGIKGNLIKYKHLTSAELESMTDDEIIIFNDKIKEKSQNLAQRPPNEENLSQRKEMKGKEKKEKEKIEREQKSFRFSPPTIDEVFSFFIEKNLKENFAKSESEKFVNFYEAKGWLIGKNKMQKWKSAASGWISRMNDFNKNQNGNTNSNGNSTNSGYKPAIVDREKLVRELTSDAESGNIPGQY